MPSFFFTFAFIFSSLFALALPALAQDKVYESEGQKFRIEELLKRADVIWGFDFLPDGRIIFTERTGAVNLFDPKSKAVVAIEGTPKVWQRFQGGMLDVRVRPSGPPSGSQVKIFLTYSEPLPAGGTTVLASGTLVGNQLKDFKKLLSAHEANNQGLHFGSRIEFDDKGHVFFTVGDRNKRDQVQDLNYHIGKSMRLKEDGSVPSDNPFSGKKGAKPEIWTVGHRSPQGLARNPETGDLWLAEMGPRGGDEINVLRPGSNYGWPDVTFGREYHGPSIGVTEKAGTEPPVAHWVPSVSPSAMTFYTGSSFPKWKGNVFLACLSGQQLRRIVIDGKKAVKQEELMKDLNYRFRNVRTGPDGALYFSTDDGRIARLIPAK